MPLGSSNAVLRSLSTLPTVSSYLSRRSLTGWQPVRVAGQQAFVSGHSVTWASRGFVYTVIADAPAQTVSQLVGVLPPGGQPGLLSRFGRGFGRLARLVGVFR